MDSLDRAAQAVLDALRRRNLRVALAESCTAGLAAAALARIPGASDRLCGSAVVYRNSVKHAWLDVSQADLDNPRIGPVSPQVAEAMARGVLRMTPEADVSAAVTGHLGPDAPPELDGVVEAAAALRSPSAEAGVLILLQRRIVLAGGPDPLEVRRRRQWEAAEFLLTCLCDAIAVES